MFLVSGGFEELINPVAKMLNIPVSNVYANRLMYFFDGELQASRLMNAAVATV